MGVGPAVSESSATLRARWERLLSERAGDRVEAALDAWPEVRSIALSWAEIDASDPDLAATAWSHPDVALAAAADALGLRAGSRQPKPQLSLRLRGGPPPAHLPIRALRARHIGQTVVVPGIVRKATEVRGRIERATFACRKCGATVSWAQPEGEALEEPEVCPEEQGGCGQGSAFRLVVRESVIADVQRLQIEELVEAMAIPVQPQRLNCFTRQPDVIDEQRPFERAGERVRLTGVLRGMATRRQGTEVNEWRYALEVLDIEPMEEEDTAISLSPEDEKRLIALAADPDHERKLVASLAPGIWGMEREKLAVWLAALGGTQKAVGGARLRGDIHVLLVGDPGCLAAGTMVALGDGSLAPIETLGTRHLEPINVQVLTGQSARKTAFAKRFHKYESQPTLIVRTKAGRIIRGTPNHPLLVGLPGKPFRREWRRMDHLRIGDKLAVSSGFSSTVVSPKALNWSPKPRFESSSGPKPQRLPTLADDDLCAFLGYAAGDGWITDTALILIVNAEESDLIPKLKAMAERCFQRRPRVRQRKRPGKQTMTEIEVNSVDLVRNLGFLRRPRRVPGFLMSSSDNRVAIFLRWLFEADGCVLTHRSMGRSIKPRVSLKQADAPLLHDVQLLLQRLGIYSRVGKDVLSIDRREAVIKFAKKIGFASEKKQRRLSAAVEISREPTKKRFSTSPRFDKIASIEQGESTTVYDIEIPGANRFLANGIVSHNTGKSALLKAAQRIAPRCVYSSGKGASAAGLTAAVVRDEFDGRFAVEAGAMILANGGLLAADELDKMDEHDRDALHQGMEQQEVSINKAGISATFRTECAVLAACNPKLGRFDEFTAVAAQIDLKPALFSRFDLICVVKEKMDRARDEALAELVGAMHRAGSGGPPLNGRGAPYDGPTLRRFVSYARTRCRPALTGEAVALVNRYYVDLRAHASKDESRAVPITARQLEALYRMSEALAKVRLSSEATEDDARRAIALYAELMQRVGVDPETGALDFDLIAVGTARSQQQRMAAVIGAILEGARQSPRGVPTDEVLRLAQAKGVPEAKVREALDQMKQRGQVYQPEWDKWLAI